MSAENVVLTCFYEVLGVERDATTSEIKKAYYKMALKWHPDKNQDREDEANKRFQEIGNAYTVLSDKHERAWYDEHREDILRGGDGTSESGEGQHGVNVWRYFSSSCFSGYGDGAEVVAELNTAYARWSFRNTQQYSIVYVFMNNLQRGFYAVYRTLFEKVAAEEDASEGGREFPTFGRSDTPYADVREFYMAWEGFSTKMSFSWADEYNTTQAENRRVRRAMEIVNKKARSKMKREYNEKVRHLVTSVKKRDKRVIKAKLEMQKEREEKRQRAIQRKKHEEAARKKYRARMQKEREALLERQMVEDALNMERTRHARSEAACIDGAGEGDDALSEGEEDMSGLTEEELLLLLGAEGLEAMIAEGGDDALLSGMTEEELLLLLGPDELAKLDIDGFVGDIEEVEEGGAAEAEETSSVGEGDECPSGAGESEDEEASQGEAEEQEEEVDMRSAWAGGTNKPQDAGSGDDEGAGEEPEELPLSKSERRRLRKEKRKNKKIAKQNGTAPSPAAAPAPTSRENTCSVCGSTFPSRSKLFKHIKTKGHARAK